MPRKIRNILRVVFLLIVTSILISFAPGQTAGKGDAAKSSEQKYAKYIFYDTKPVPAEFAAKMKQMKEKTQSTVESTRIVDLDNSRTPGAPYMDFVWLWKGSAKGYTEQEHTHTFDEVIGFIGSKRQNDPHGLGGEMEVWIGGEKYLITKSCLIFVPTGTKHCPIRFNRVDSPILFFTVGNTGKYSRS
jgi:hypothetical protein